MGYNIFNMLIFLYILIVIELMALVLIASVVPARSDLSLYEIRRRVDLGDRIAKKVLKREQMIDDVMSLKYVISVALMALIALSCAALFGWLTSVIISVFVAYFHGIIANNSLVKKLSLKIYNKSELQIRRLSKRLPDSFGMIKNIYPADLGTKRIGSNQELRFLIEKSDDILTIVEKKLINGGLAFDAKSVDLIMTHLDKIVSIDKSEFLGPLMLDDLHKFGHGILPVVDGGMDKIVGVLYLNKLLMLDVKQSMTAGEAMAAGVCYIREDYSLRNALAVFLKTRQSMLIVINARCETVGILTLNDVVAELFGCRVVDEFDAHDNPHAVSVRKRG